MACINTVISKILLNYVNPLEYSKLMKDINENHAGDFVELKQDGSPPAFYKVLFTTTDTIIVENLSFKGHMTRFEVRKIDAAQWDDYFVRWINYKAEDETNTRIPLYGLLSLQWKIGAGMYEY